MAKNQQQRVGNPAEQAVPWGQQPNPLNTIHPPVASEESGGANGMMLPQFSQEGQAQITPEKADAVEPFIDPAGHSHESPAPNVAIDPAWKPEQQTSPFAEQPPKKSPFAPKSKPVTVDEVKVHPLGDNDPTWLQLVQFCQKHGNDIIQARYPHPRGECIDTIYRGVTVFAHPSTQVRHKMHGWIDWQDAIYD